MYRTKRDPVAAARFLIWLGITIVICSLPSVAEKVIGGPDGKDEARDPVQSGQPNLIRQENAKKGTSAWTLSNPALNHEIEGYASLTSVNRGDSIGFYVNTIDPLYSITVFRLGWYGGSGARQMTSPVTLPGVRQPSPTFDAQTRLLECNWVNPYVLFVPSAPSTEWVSGLYLVKLTALPSMKQSYITFVVRDDFRTSALLFQSSIMTYEAYNPWGGWSLYTVPQAYKVSFNRPFDSYWYGAPQLFHGAWEYSMLRFLEREGYDVSYSTDVDTHERGDSLMLHKGFLVVGHDEYWSWEMRTNIEMARDRQVNLGFFSANDGYWQIRFESSPATGAPDRVIVCYKHANLDPVFNAPDQSHIYLTTSEFRYPPVNRPEAELIGVMYDRGWGEDDDMVIADPSSWVFQGTGVKQGDHLKGLLGYETDRVFDSSPSGVHVLAHSPFQPGYGGDYEGKSQPQGNSTLHSDMTVYTAQSGSIVVATGSMQWCWGLDEYPHSDRVNKVAQQATRNILAKFGAGQK